MHGPERCEGCGLTHTPVWWHMDEEGLPKAHPIRHLAVKLYSVTSDGKPLYVEATQEEIVEEWERLNDDPRAR